jgi:hypothetical protein
VADGRLVSPNDMMAAAKEQMLDGREPEGRDDWILVVNFVAANIQAEVAESATLVFKTLFSIPLDDELIKEIVQFQNEHRAKP